MVQEASHSLQQSSSKNTLFVVPDVRSSERAESADLLLVFLPNQLSSRQAGTVNNCYTDCHVAFLPLPGQVAVKLLTVDAEDPAVLDAFLKEVALCACLRGSSRVVRLLGACLGGTAAAQQQQQAQPSDQLSSTSASGVSSMAPAGQAAEASVQSAASILHWSSSQTSTGGADAPRRYCSSSGTACSSSGHAHREQQQQPPQQQLALIMELVEGGNLAQRIYHPSKRRLSYLEVWCRGGGDGMRGRGNMLQWQ
jgi:hypothetical protein